MLRELRPSELGSWAGLWVVDPWDERRADLRAGVVASTIANVNRDPKRRAIPFRPSEFMPYAEAEEMAKSEMVSRDLRAIFKTMRR